MKNMILIAACAMLASAASAQVYVRPHTTQNGTYVEGHIRSSPNSTKVDNYSSQGNSNPFTGQQGTADPFKPSPPSGFQTAPSGNQNCFIAANGQYRCQ